MGGWAKSAFELHCNVESNEESWEVLQAFLYPVGSPPGMPPNAGESTVPPETSRPQNVISSDIMLGACSAHQECHIEFDSPCSVRHRMLGTLELACQNAMPTRSMEPPNAGARNLEYAGVPSTLDATIITEGIPALSVSTDAHAASRHLFLVKPGPADTTQIVI